MKRKLKSLGIGLLVVGLAVLPGIGAGFELGSALDRLQAREQAKAPKGEPEVIGTYEFNPDTMEGALRLHQVMVVNAHH